MDLLKEKCNSETLSLADPIKGVFNVLLWAFGLLIAHKLLENVNAIPRSAI